MRYYDCFYYTVIRNKKNKKEKDFVLINNTACWAGLESINNFYSSKFSENYQKIPNIIYIDQWKDFIDIIKIKKLIYIINKITPCRIIKWNNKDLIAFRLINPNWYNNNLIILNWIRNTWYQPKGFDTKSFFESIMKYKDNQDPFEFLMKCSSNNFKGKYGFNHSNVGPNMKPKKKNEILTREITENCRDFLKK